MVNSDRLSHAVTLVGFGLNETNVVDVNGTETDLTTFWSIKNSWGTNWGEYGYFRIAKLGKEEEQRYLSIYLKLLFKVITVESLLYLV